MKEASRMLAPESVIAWIVIGAVAGWLAGLLVKGYGFGLIGNIIVGILRPRHVAASTSGAEVHDSSSKAGVHVAGGTACVTAIIVTLAMNVGIQAGSKSSSEGRLTSARETAGALDSPAERRARPAVEREP
jgi:uncharacterized membrane protein YeaQ/YmgE (transglycosylase-associated protein family)